MDESIIVSVVCTTYNHEKYLKTALESVVSQIMDYSFEVIIGDDCSTDKSADIIRDFEKRYPNLITAVYRDKNIGAADNLRDLYGRTKGKYVILLETDDFWIDRRKLQKQVDYLENHPECFEVAHRCIVVDKNGNPRGIQYCECHDSMYTLKHFERYILPGQTATCMFRNFYKYEYGYNFELLLNKSFEIGPGDRRCAFMMASQVKVACLPDVMSAYRFVQDEGSSYSATTSTLNSTLNVDFSKNIMKFAHTCLFDNPEAIKCSEYNLVREVLVGLLKGKNGYSFSLLKTCIKETSFPVRSTIRAFVFCVLALIRKPFNLNATFKRIDSTSESILLEKHQKDMSLLFGETNE